MAAVLLVEDDADTREVVRMLLEEEGYSVVCAKDGQDAVVHLATCEDLPCLVLLDLQMPRVGGVAVLRWMRDHPRVADVPVALISARPQSNGAEIAAKFRDHVISVLQKPFDLDRVLKLLEDHCEPEQPAA
jgi:chemosensory pili system protein ChpA (sensor histidine kinase/response regulator)